MTFLKHEWYCRLKSTMGRKATQGIHLDIQNILPRLLAIQIFPIHFVFVLSVVGLPVILVPLAIFFVIDVVSTVSTITAFVVGVVFAFATQATHKSSGRAHIDGRYVWGRTNGGAFEGTSTAEAFGYASTASSTAIYVLTFAAMPGTSG